MSGICAVMCRDGRPVGPADVQPMLAALAGWGTDDGLWAPRSAEAPAGLGCRRAVSLPEDAFDHQPLCSADGNIVVVADARIDNRAQLAARLGIDAQREHELPDSAFVLAAYQAWGEECPRHLLGDFAFVLWDGHRRVLFMARDHLGRRVLFYHLSPRLVAACSAIRGLLALADVPFRLNETKVAEFLVLLEDAETTFYDSILRLAPAHTMTVSEEGVSIRRYWSLERRAVRLGSDRAYVEAFLDVFGEAVRARLRTAGGVAVMLSGGLDSSSVAAVAAKQLAAEGRRLTALHAAPRAGFRGTPRKGWTIDESDDVRSIAALHENVDVCIVRPDGRTPLDNLDRLFRVVGSPVRNPINLPWVDQIYELARDRGAGTLLTGQKGNATISFTGFRSLRELLPAGRWGTLLREVRALARTRGRTTRNVLLEDVLIPLLPAPIIAAIERSRGQANRPIWDANASAIQHDFARELRVEERAVQTLMDERSRRHAEAFTYRKLMLTAGGDGPDLTHAYRAHFGVQPRDPTSDVRVVEFCLGIPGDQYLRGGVDRFLVRRALRGLLPDRVLDKTVHGEQAADWYERFQPLQGVFAAEIERLERSDMARRCLDVPRLRRIVEQWPDPLGPEHLTEFSLVLLRGVAMGRFLLWFEEAERQARRA